MIENLTVEEAIIEVLEAVQLEKRFYQSQEGVVFRQIPKPIPFISPDLLDLGEES